MDIIHETSNNTDDGLEQLLDNYSPEDDAQQPLPAQTSPLCLEPDFPQDILYVFGNINTLRGECSILPFAHTFVIIKYHWSRKHICTIINNYKEIDINISILG